MSKFVDVIKDLPAPVQDLDCDAVLYLCVKNGTLVNLGFTGTLPGATTQKEHLYRLLMEAGYAVAFQQPKTEQQHAG